MKMNLDSLKHPRWELITSLNEITKSFRVINDISIKGAATDFIIYQIIDINVNIYDIILYHEWRFKEKEKNQKKKNIIKYINIIYKNYICMY